MEMIQYNRFIETLVLLSCCLVVPLTVANDVRYCDNAKYDVKVHGVIQSLGEACDLIICNNRCSNIWGTLVIEFSYFGWHIYGETHNLRDETSYLVSRGGFIQIHTF